MVVNHSQRHSYREVLVQQKMPTHSSSATMKIDKGVQAPLPSGIARAQWSGEGSRRVVGLANDGMHITLLDVQTQLSILQEKVEVFLIRCVEEDGQTGLGVVHGLGLGYEACDKLKDPEGTGGQSKGNMLGHKQTGSTRTGPGPMVRLVGLQVTRPNVRTGTHQAWRIKGEWRGWAFYRQETVNVAGEGADEPNGPSGHSVDWREDDGDTEKLNDGKGGPKRRR